MAVWVVRCASQSAPSGFGLGGGPGITAYFSCIRRINLFVCRLGDSTTVQSAFALPADLGHRGVEGCTLFVGALDDRRPLFSKGSHYDVHLLSSGTDSGNASPHLGVTPGQRGDASRLRSRYCVPWMRDVCSGCARLAHFFFGATRDPGEAALALRTAHP